ncbi:MAG: flagellar basal body P-ring formation protein FlgA [Oxalobacter sp.]|nr:MAG: flagellar basal body P-ring formation protein FlgA [Oxalobacter sp.]
MKRFIQPQLALMTLFVALFAASASFAQTAGPRQDLEVLRSKVEQLLKAQSAGMPGEIKVVVHPLDPRTSLAACDAPEAFMLPGRRAWGKTSVGVRCNAPAKWTAYVKATVKVTGEYLVAAKPLAQGHIVSQDDLVKIKGDLATLQPGVMTNSKEILGQKVSMSIPLGAPIRKSWLRPQLAVQSGQTVRLVSLGSGFRVTAEGRALGSANEGQLVQTRTPSGQTVSGIARSGGVVEVTF